MEQPFTDILIRIRKGSRTSYPVEAWLSDGSFYEGQARLTDVQLQKLLLSTLEPVRYGEQLFKVLFDGPIASAYDVATGLARQRSDGRLRIRLLLDESVPAELHELKWERVANLQGKPLACSGLTPFSRYTALPEAEPEPLDEPVVRLLFVVSAPNNLEAKDNLEAKELARITVEEVVRRLLGALAGVWSNGRCQATILPGQTGLSPELCSDLEASGCRIASGNATLDNIVRLLCDQHARVFHFLGHGQYRSGHGYLVLEEEDGTLKGEMDTYLAAALVNTPVRLVFLAACESSRRDAEQAFGTPRASSFPGLAATLMQQGIPAVVGMQEAFSIDAACRLTGEFYRRLFLEHGVVDRALNEARALLYRQNELDWATPVLSMRIKTGQLATANPVWSALLAIREHPDYADFQPGSDYVTLPLQALLVNERQDPSQYDLPEPQRIGTLDLKDAVLEHLVARRSSATEHTSARSLVLVLGGPSTGRSTQMKRLGWETVQAGLQTPAEQIFLPLYLSLKEYRPGTGEALEGNILDKLRLFLPDLAARSLGELAKQMPQARLRLLFSAGDTLPEVGRDLVRLTVALAREHPRHQFVLTIPPSALKWEDLNDITPAERCVLAIQPLTQRVIRHALQAQGEPGQQLLDALNETSVSDLASRPFFFVKMLTRARKGQLPASRSQVLRELIDEAIAQVPARQGMRVNALRTLSELALEMQRGDITVWPIEEVFRVMSSVRGERGYSIERLYDSLVKEQLLLPVGEEAVRFAYRPIQAYCCARAILSLPERDKTLSELVASLGSPLRARWWDETLVIASGLLAMQSRSDESDEQQTLRRLLEPIINGADLLEGTRAFLGARCLLECLSVLTARACIQAREKLDKLVDHVVNALLWRSDSATEPDLERRLEATQLLAQLAKPEVAVNLARKAYSLVRKNVADQWDYEFSSVRFAAAIALKRMAPDLAKAALNDISPKIVELFAAWNEKDVDALIRHSKDAEDLGIQGLAALALGDLHGPLESANQLGDARRSLDRLIEMFTSGETRQNVRWALADALSLIDSARVIESMVDPLLREFCLPGGTHLKNRNKIRKALAYLIGLLRLQDERARDFLVRKCLGLEGEKGSRDWSTWATSIRALGRVAAKKDDMQLLADIAAGRLNGKGLEEVLRQPAQRNYVRREAINALANQANLEGLSPEDCDHIAREPALSKAYYQAIQEIYWRSEAVASATLGRIL